MYCSKGLESGTSVFTFDRSAHMYRNKIWASRQLLKVTFLNPELLVQWGLTVDNVLDWANEWNSDSSDEVPKFARKNEKGDIRVQFSGKYNIKEEELEVFYKLYEKGV